MDLRAGEQSRIDWVGGWVGVRRSAIRSARSVPAMENASVPEENSRGRQAGALRREDDSGGRLVFDATKLCGRRADHRRCRQLFGRAAAEGQPHGDQERDAGGRDDFGGAEDGRYFRGETEPLSEKSGRQLHQDGAAAGAKFPPVVPVWIAGRAVSRGDAVYQRRTRVDRSDARAAWSRALPQGRASTTGKIQRRREADVRSSDGRVSLRYSTRGRSAMPSDRTRFKCVRESMHGRVRQSLPVFLSCGGV